MYIEYKTAEESDDRFVPIEDIGVVLLENHQITITNALLSALMENQCMVIVCDEKHLPSGLLLPMHAHHAFTEKLSYQINASVPLKKNLWRQTVIAKINNQATLLRMHGLNNDKLQFLLRKVRSGDPENIEGRAASYYWDVLFGNGKSFIRDRSGDFINQMLNYGYAVLLGVIARALVISGMLPSLGIHHRNKYNPWCLASDIMEPYRPFVDQLVLEIAEKFPEAENLTPAIKKELLQIPVVDVQFEDMRSPLMIGAQRTTASLATCFEGKARKMIYPTFPAP